MARPRSAGYDDQRELILRHAAELFAQQGYAATSMNQVAAACGVSKAALYHYVRDKNELLAHVAEAHVRRLAKVVDEVLAEPRSPEARLRELIVRFVREYASARNEHRVLTEDVDRLEPDRRDAVLGVQRGVVAAFADAVAAVRPEARQAELHKPLAMLLFGMINWMFTWFRPGEPLTHEQMAPIVADLFFGGLPAVRAPAPATVPAASLTPVPARTPPAPTQARNLTPRKLKKETTT
jgi:AcrR family transcriptional regulator